MAKYRKKPVVIEAFCYGEEIIPQWFFEKIGNGITITIPFPLGVSERCIIETLEGNMCGTKGDYIIQGVNGEIYPCKPDIFEKTYEKVEE